MVKIGIIVLLGVISDLRPVLQMVARGESGHSVVPADGLVVVPHGGYHEVVLRVEVEQEELVVGALVVDINANVVALRDVVHVSEVLHGVLLDHDEGEPCVPAADCEKDAVLQEKRVGVDWKRDGGLQGNVNEFRGVRVLVYVVPDPSAASVVGEDVDDLVKVLHGVPLDELMAVSGVALAEGGPVLLILLHHVAFLVPHDLHRVAALDDVD